jgi:hypothetical protein
MCERLVYMIGKKFWRLHVGLNIHQIVYSALIIHKAHSKFAPMHV